MALKVAVTGGAGYIGSHVVRDLLDHGHKVVVVDDMSSGSEENIFTSEKSYDFRRGDVNTDAGLRLLFDGQPDVIFHFAALKAAGESMEVPERYAGHNIRGTLRLQEEMVRRGVSRIVFSSSAAVYGEPKYLPVDEEHPREPINYYGFTKKVIEDNLIWFSRLRHIRYAALRYFNAAGYDVEGRVRGLESGSQNLLPIVMETAVGRRKELNVYGTDYETRDGTCIRDYIHVNDLARAHTMAMDKIHAGNIDVVVNLGAEKGITVKEVIDCARRVTGKPVPTMESPRRAGDPPVLVASSRRAKDLLGWEAKHSDVETLVTSMWRIYSSLAQGEA